MNVQCWRHLADNVNICLRKGEPVLVMGRLRIRHYDDTEGKSRTAVEIDAHSVGHDLTRGVAHFFRASRAAGRTAAEAAEAAEPGSGDVPEPGEQTTAAANGDGVIDEQAVAEFAKELDESLGAGAAVGPDTGADPDAGTASVRGVQS